MGGRSKKRTFDQTIAGNKNARRLSANGKVVKQVKVEKLTITTRVEECSDGLICQYCGRPDPKDDEKAGVILNARDVYGKFGSKDHARAHYCCVFFAQSLKQQDPPTMEDLFGFRPADVTRNLKKFQSTKCIYCKKPHAALGCKQCSAHFHFPCAFENEVMFDYQNFTCLCPKHRRVQQVPSSSPVPPDQRCVICQDDVDCEPGFRQLFVACCKRWYHRDCLQAYAFSAASHHLKCPLCNDVDTFKKELIHFGFHVPMRDAAWERDPDAFRSMYETEFSCSANHCICPNGRAYAGGGKRSKYGQLTCSMCGCNSVHRSCTATAHLGDAWVCEDCSIDGSNDSFDDNEEEGNESDYL